MKIRYAALIGVAAVALAGCTSIPDADTTTAPTTRTSAAPDTSWAPIGMVHVGTLAWSWTPKGEVNCKSYQDGCYGVTVATRDGCPNGIYIELAIQDSGGAVIDKANEITAGLRPGDVAKAVLSPPTGVPSGAKAKVSKISCL